MTEGGGKRKERNQRWDGGKARERGRSKGESEGGDRQSH